MCGGDAAFLSYYLDGLSYIYTIINTTDEFRNMWVTAVGMAGWAWSLHGKRT